MPYSTSIELVVLGVNELMISHPRAQSIIIFKNGGLMKRKQKVHDCLRSSVREKEGHETTLRSAIIDSLRCKTTETSVERGYDAGKIVPV